MPRRCSTCNASIDTHGCPYCGGAAPAPSPAPTRQALEAALAEAVRRSRLPVSVSGMGLPSTREQTNAAIERCVGIAVAYIMEPLRDLLSARGKRP